MDTRPCLEIAAKMMGKTVEALPAMLVEELCNLDDMIQKARRPEDGDSAIGLYSRQVIALVLCGWRASWET